jgi:hypothetical protein
MSYRYLISACVTAAVLASCSSSEWSKASTANTISAYQEFLARHPRNAHAHDAAMRLAALKDDQAWNTAQVASSIEGYQQYIAAEPNGAHLQIARENVTSRERADTWQALQANMTAITLKQFLQKFPSGPEADQARDELAILAGYRAELATASNRAAAERERLRLARRFRKLLPQMVLLQPNRANPEFRITSGAMSEKQAANVCANVEHFCQVIADAS